MLYLIVCQNCRPVQEGGVEVAEKLCSPMGTKRNTRKSGEPEGEEVTESRYCGTAVC